MYGAPEWTKFKMAIDDEIDRRSSMSTVDLRCRPSIFDVDRQSSMYSVYRQWTSDIPNYGILLVF